MAELSLQIPLPQKHYFSSIWVCGSCRPNAKAICLNKHWSIWQKNVVNILARNYLHTVKGMHGGKRYYHRFEKLILVSKR